ncbi:MAG: ATP-binding cassette domain-containing protein [Thermoanaerobaculia bacterium]|nr:ATP-binding cassette domain-containing protein [Thermoanaerobaculia bacterium]
MVLESVGLGKAYRGGTWGVRNLTLRAKEGVLGLLGPNGAGKTTLMQMLATLTRPTEGALRFAGIDVAKEPAAIRERLGYLPQDFGVPPGLTCFELLDTVARLKGIRSRSAVLSMLERVGLHEFAKRPVENLSGGMRQRLGIAQALVGSPELVIVDEPTAGLDPEERVRFRNLLSEHAGLKLVLLSTHIVSDVESVATEIAVVRKGGLLAFGAPDELVAGAAGAVWEAELPATELERLRPGLTVANLVRNGNVVKARLVGRERPVAQAAPAAPSLEDAYLLLMREAGEALPAVA